MRKVQVQNECFSFKIEICLQTVLEAIDEMAEINIIHNSLNTRIFENILCTQSLPVLLHVDELFRQEKKSCCSISKMTYSTKSSSGQIVLSLRTFFQK